VRQLVIKAMNIIDARCNHGTYKPCFIVPEKWLSVHFASIAVRQA